MAATGVSFVTPLIKGTIYEGESGRQKEIPFRAEFSIKTLKNIFLLLQIAMTCNSAARTLNTCLIQQAWHILMAKMLHYSPSLTPLLRMPETVKTGASARSQGLGAQKACVKLWDEEIIKIQF